MATAPKKTAAAKPAAAGDSRIRAPAKDSWARDVLRVKGGVTDYCVIGEIDVQARNEEYAAARHTDDGATAHLRAGVERLTPTLPRRPWRRGCGRPTRPAASPRCR